MKKRILGCSGIEVSEIGMGCMGLTHASGEPLPDDEGVRVIRKAYDIGYSFFDTAQCYIGMRSDGTIPHNEDLLGEAFAGMRDEVVIATKFGVEHTPDKTLLLDSSPETIRTSIDESLKRLRTDHIDLYYQHRIDPNIEPETVAEVMGEVDLRRQDTGMGNLLGERRVPATSPCSVPRVGSSEPIFHDGPLA